MKRTQHIAFLLTISLSFLSLHGQNLDFSGQVIGWSTLNPSDPLKIKTGGRFIPEISFSLPVGKLTIEGEASANLWGTATYVRNDSVYLEEKISPYRGWIKLSGEQFELRAGLQKINFGSANMIRPLMWFDQLDPKDPLQLTNGVYGLLGRYYFLNNANIWLWGLYGNNERKGLETFPSKKNSLEYGGRIQLPIPIGEIAASYHHRTADPNNLASVFIPFSPENRYAIDAKVDVGIGAWFEGALVQQSNELIVLHNSTLLNVGLDYTFNIGNGLHVMGESLFYLIGENAFQSDQSIVFGGVSINYPLNIIHNLSAIVFLDASNKELYRFLNWSIAFDKWSFYTMAFWNPERYLLPGFEQEANIFSGYGIQVMAVYNY
jgi:hypothetical protein